MSGSEQLVQCHDGADHKQASRKRRVGLNRRGETRPAFPLRRLLVWGVTLGAGSLLAFSVSPVTAKPCAEHTGKDRTACVKQLKRDRMAWPPRPTEAEVKKRVGWWWNKALRISVCETGGNWQHYPNGTYIGGLGMYRGTYGIGQSVTGYRWPAEGATRQEQIAVGYIVAQRFGVMAWSCGAA